MNEFRTKVLTQSTINAVLLTGFMSILMHPFVVFGYHLPDLGFLSWFHLIPLMLVAHRYGLKHKILLAFVASLIAHYGTFFWLMNAMQRFGGLNFFQGLFSLTLMSCMFALIFAVFFGFAAWVTHLIKVPYFFILPVFLVTRDYFLHELPFGGFPWGIASYSQREWIQFFQWVDVTGILGLSLFIYLINALLADGLLLFIHRKQIDKLVSRVIVAFVLVLVSLYASFLSGQEFEKTKVSKGNVNIAMIQGNIPQDMKWDPFRAQDNLDVHLKLTRTAVKDNADVVIWPETSYPYSIRNKNLDTETFLDKSQLLSPILFGAIMVDRQKGERRIQNAVIYANTEAKYETIYKKQHLVPFGEYLPYKKIFGFLEGMTQGIGEFVPGDEYKIFDINGIKYGSLICFEDIFPRYGRIFSDLGADILVNYTNDAWYGDTSAQHQHLVFSQFRALENRRYVVRSTNTGMTAIINPRGEIVASLEPFKRAYLLKNIKLDVGYSYFTKYGHKWIKVVATLCFLIFVYALTKRWLGPVKIEF